MHIGSDELYRRIMIDEIPERSFQTRVVEITMHGEGSNETKLSHRSGSEAAQRLRIQ